MILGALVRQERSDLVYPQRSWMILAPSRCCRVVSVYRARMLPSLEFCLQRRMVGSKHLRGFLICSSPPEQESCSQRAWIIPHIRTHFLRRMFPSCLLKVNHLGVDDSPTADSLHPILKILIRASWMIRLFEWFLSQNGSSVFHALK